MSAFGAIDSLQNTLINVSPNSKRIISELYVKLQQWKRILERVEESSKSKSRKKVNAVDGRIKDTIWNFEDLLESFISHQITLQLQSSEGEVPEEDDSEEEEEEEDDNEEEEEEEEEEDVDFGEGEGNVSLFSIDLQSLRNDFDSFIQTVDNMMEEYVYEVDNMPEDEDVDASCISSSSTTAAAAEKMIGFSQEFKGLKKWLLVGNDDNIVCGGIVGMAGVGKTTLARKIYEDPEILSYFEFRLWITLGRKSYPLLNQDVRTMLAELKGDEKCLIVLDDAWETQELPSLLTSFLEMKNTTICILITTRERNVFACAESTLARFSTDHDVLRFLNEDESKDLLCHKVFGEDSIFPPQLVKAATKIAKKCEGLPLMIVTVADLLSKAQNNDPKYWEDVAEERNSVFTDAYDAISKVLYSSYDYLPGHLKMPFLYLGVFPRYYDIPLSKILNTMAGEGLFLSYHYKASHEVWVDHCLTILCDHHNLVLWKPKSTHWYSEGGLSRFKTCRLHSSWHYLCRVEARKNKFYHVLNRLVDTTEETMRGQRSLCLENNLLFGLTEFSNSVRLNSASYVRSLFFFGPYHQYPTPIDAIGFKLLRELDALQLRFYTFPTQVVALVQLKYLALTCNGQLPPTISKLFNLKTLIVHPHMSITKCCDTDTDSYTASSSIPIEIWDMKELEHIEILGKNLLPPPKHANSLKKMLRLIGVNAASICNIQNPLKRFRKIEKLAFQMELTPYDVVDHDLILRCFAHISEIKYLGTLKCSIINTVLVEHGRYFAPSPRPLMLPHGLKKLHLSGMGFPWEYMDVIGNLPYLEVLKLRCYAFRGSKWETENDSFRRLLYLVIEDSDLVQWKPASNSFRKLSYLSLKHCYKLQEFHWPSDARVAKIELVDCNPLAVTCAKKFHKVDEDSIYYVSVTASDSFEA